MKPFPTSEQSRKEFGYIRKIGLPLIAAYLSEFLMMITTKIVVSQLGYLELAAVGISSDLSLEILFILIGILSIVGVLCAGAEGAGNKGQAGVAVRQGVFLSTVIGIPATWLIWNLDILLVWTGQDPEVIELSRPYLHFLSPFLLATLYFSVLRNFVTALSRTRIIMVISAIAVPANYGLAMWFVHGGLGIPAMGVAGAGLALTIVSWMMFILLFLHIYRNGDLRGYGVFTGRWQIDFQVCREILVLGIPVGGLLLLEGSMFTLVSVLAGIISAETLAAYQIALAWFGIPFVVALGIAEAVMVRVAHGAGDQNWQSARNSGIIGIVFGIVLLTFMIVIPLGLTDMIISIFIREGDSGFDTVAKLATSFLLIAALFQVFDGMQAVAARALRGLKDSLMPLWIAGFGYWVMGIGGGVLLAFVADMKGIGLMWGLAMGLFTTGILLTIRFHKLTGKRIAQVARW
ncbi:MAG: MATE family efflux transporter [Gammaproteobacteria bacterium]|nr:MATE family efflux transporter [Gammaproteobacteria bacterium]